MKNLVIIIILLNSCNSKENKNNILEKLNPIEINNYKVKMKINFQNDTIYHFKLQGYDLGDSRYISYVDEKNENIKSLYKKYKLKDFNSEKTFKSAKNDTIYTFPLSEQNPDKLFSTNYSNKDFHKFYLTAYKDEKYGQVIIIDSIR